MATHTMHAMQGIWRSPSSTPLVWTSDSTAEHQRTWRHLAPSGRFQLVPKSSHGESPIKLTLRGPITALASGPSPGKHETCAITDFKYGVANRGASIRIPRDTEKSGKGPIGLNDSRNQQQDDENTEVDRCNCWKNNDIDIDVYNIYIIYIYICII